MYHMKKLCAALLAALLMGTMSGCGGSTERADSGKLRIVTTIFPEYDWVCQILGEEIANVEVTMLLDNGVDLHSYQPAADDIIKISSCDLFIHVGGESSQWVEDALAEAVNKDMVVIDQMALLADSVVEEEYVEGMEHEHDESCDHSHEGAGYDEHVWLSLRNAGIVCGAIAEQLAVLDPDNAAVYAANAADYEARLEALDAEYAAAVEGAAFDTLLFADRFPFRYLVEDYGISYYAAFAGCSAETEASFDTIVFLSEKLEKLGLDSVLIIDNADSSIAKTIIGNTSAGTQTVRSLDSMQSTTLKDAAAGVTYLSIMESNLEVLKAALN